MAIDATNDVPAVGLETGRRIVREPAVYFTVDGNAVVVVEHDELRQLQRAGECTGFVRDAFHEAAIAEEHPGTVINNSVARAIEVGSEHFLRQRHAHGIRYALP